MDDSKCISDYMVRSPSIAEGWQPVSLIRQRMLTDSFSFLPVQLDGQWKVVADYKLAKWLRTAPNKGKRKERLAASLDDARKNGLDLVDPVTTKNGKEVSELLANTDGRPILVVDNEGRLLGIATPYDLL